MPRREVHDAVEQLLLGTVTGMSELMDAPSKTLRGNHQVLYHTVGEVVVLARQLGGDFTKNVLAGMLHIELDKMMKEGKRRKRANGRE